MKTCSECECSFCDGCESSENDVVRGVACFDKEIAKAKAEREAAEAEAARKEREFLASVPPLVSAFPEDKFLSWQKQLREAVYGLANGHFSGMKNNRHVQIENYSFRAMMTKPQGIIGVAIMNELQ